MRRSRPSSSLGERLNPPPGRILVVKLADIGDVLTATPALRALRETYPEATIDVLVTPRSVEALRGSRFVDRLWEFDKFQFDRPKDALRPIAVRALLRLAQDLRAIHYDAVLILHHLTLRFGRLKYAALALVTGAPVRAGLDNGHGWFLTHRAIDAGFGVRHEVEYALSVASTIGASTSDTRLEAPFSIQAEEWAENVLARWRENAGTRRFVVLHPGSGGYSLARRWPPTHFARVAEELRNKWQLGIVFVGSAGDDVERVRDIYEGPALDLSGQTTLAQLAALLKRASLFVGADSGVMHMAAAVGTPLIAIFGPTNDAAWGPWTAGASPAVVVRADTDCQPCAYVGYAIGRREGCEEKTCMRRATPEMVLAVAENLLK